MSPAPESDTRQLSTAQLVFELAGFRIHASRFLFTLVYINLWRLERPITIRYEELYGNSLLLLLFNATRIANSHVGWFIFLYQKQMAQNS